MMELILPAEYLRMLPKKISFPITKYDVEKTDVFVKYASAVFI